MSTTNLLPGTEVPSTGTYVCTMCRHGDAAIRDAVAEYARQKGIDAETVAGMFSGMGIGAEAPVTERRFVAGARFDECLRHKEATGWTLIEESAAALAPSPVAVAAPAPIPMMECPPFPGHVTCSDDACPCSSDPMPPAQGYLWIRHEVADTRLHCLTLAAMQGHMSTTGTATLQALRERYLPIVVCLRSATLRGLDLAAAKADYAAWVDTSRVPCRATPLATASAAPAAAAPAIVAKVVPPEAVAVAPPPVAHVPRSAAPVATAAPVAPELGQERGVAGWLRFFVVMNLYVGPAWFVLQSIAAWFGNAMLAREHPGIVAVGLLLTGVEVALVILGILAALALRDLEPRAVQRMKRVIHLRLAWAIVGAPLFVVLWGVVGLEMEAATVSAFRWFLASLVGWAIGMSYFSLSKRVKATYPDWDA